MGPARRGSGCSGYQPRGRRSGEAAAGAGRKGGRSRWGALYNGGDGARESCRRAKAGSERRIGDRRERRRWASTEAERLRSSERPRLGPRWGQDVAVAPFVKYSVAACASCSGVRGRAIARGLLRGLLHIEIEEVVTLKRELLLLGCECLGDAGIGQLVLGARLRPDSRQAHVEGHRGSGAAHAVPKAANLRRLVQSEALARRRNEDRRRSLAAALVLPLPRDLTQHARARGRAARGRSVLRAQAAAETSRGAALPARAPGHPRAPDGQAPFQARRPRPSRHQGCLRPPAGGPRSDALRAMLEALPAALGRRVGRDGHRSRRLDEHGRCLAADVAASRSSGERGLGARELLTSAGEGDAAAIVLAGSPARVALAATTDLDAARRTIDALTESDRGTDLDGAIALARSAVSSMPQVDRRVVLLSDHADGNQRTRPPPVGGDDGDPGLGSAPRLAGGALAGLRRFCAPTERDSGCASRWPAGQRGQPASIAGSSMEGRPAQGARAVVIDARVHHARSCAPARCRRDDVPVRAILTGARRDREQMMQRRSFRRQGGAPWRSSLTRPTIRSPPEARPAWSKPSRRSSSTSTSVRCQPFPTAERTSQADVGVLLDDPPGLTPEQRHVLGGFIDAGGVVLVALGPRAAAAPLGASLEPMLTHPVAWARCERRTSPGADASTAIGGLAEASRGLGGARQRLYRRRFFSHRTTAARSRPSSGGRTARPFSRAVRKGGDRSGSPAFPFLPTQATFPCAPGSWPSSTHGCKPRGTGPRRSEATPGRRGGSPGPGASRCRGRPAPSPRRERTASSVSCRTWSAPTASRSTEKRRRASPRRASASST